MPRRASFLLPVLSLAWTMSAPASEPLMDRLDQIRARHGVAAVALILADAAGALYRQGEDGSDWRVGQCGSAAATQAAVRGFGPGGPAVGCDPGETPVSPGQTLAREDPNR